MTLPSQLPSAEPSAIPSDPFACLGAVPAENTAAAPCAASFDSVFSQTGEDPSIASVDGPTTSVPSLPVNAGPAALFPSSMACMVPSPQVANAGPVVSPEKTSGKTGTLSSSTSAVAVQTEGQVDSDEQLEPAKDGDQPIGDVVLAYQYIAGQWMPQPVPQPPTLPVVAQPVTTQSASVEKLNPGNEQWNVWTAKAEPLNNLQGQQAASTTPESKGVRENNSNPATAEKMTSETAAAFDFSPEKSLPLPTAPAQTTGLAAELTTVPVKASGPAVAPATTLVAAAEKQGENFAQAADIRTTFGTPVKIASPSAVARAEIGSGVNSSTGEEEKKTLSVDDKRVNSMSRNVGTRAANRDISMSYSVSNKPVSAEITMTPAVSVSGGIQTGTPTPVAATSAPIVVQAPRLVEEIRAIADRISLIDRNSVEVRFDFNDAEKLLVRVEYRDGTVHTTFRTDSSQLRDVISTEWQAQAATAEQRSYRVADPVFNSTETKQQEFSSLGDGSGRQRPNDQPVQSGPSPFGTFGRNASSTTTAAATLPAARSETSRHLHTFA